MPLSEAEVRRIINSSRQAPFGKGTETVVDTTVRNTWEVDASKINLSHPTWHAKQHEILQKTCETLGVVRGSENVHAQLYKLLIYEEGAMFKPHKDTEKASRMFGTMVICLPSAHEGGDLVVTFNGDTKLLQSSIDSRWSSSCFAWYTDVLHEVRGMMPSKCSVGCLADVYKIKPVLSGYRVVLTFNLVYTGQSVLPGLDTQVEHHQTLKTILSKWNANDDFLPQHMIYLLAHEYTQANLRLDHLKGADRHRVDTLVSAAMATEFEVMLCLVEREIQGGVEDGDDAYGGYGGWGGYGSRMSDENHTITDVQEESLTMTRVVRLDGTMFLHDVEIEEDDIVQRNPFDGRDADNEDYEGWTGNEGCFATQWYNDAAVLIMPKQRVLEF